MPLGTLAANMLRNMLAGKPKIPRQGVIRERFIRAGERVI